MRRAAALAMLLAGWLTTPALAETETLYATHSGLPAYDLDAHGGNPFATALIAALGNPASAPAELLTNATEQASDGLQYPDLSEASEDLRLVPAAGETARALVIVFADYGDETGLISLPGAAFDAQRVGRALSAAGYEVWTVHAYNAKGYFEALDQFFGEAEGADRTLVYTTGHGVEVAGTVFLVPPEAETAPDMLSASIPLPDIRARIDGPGKRLLIYAGCRDNPMDLRPNDLGPMDLRPMNLTAPEPD